MPSQKKFSILQSAEDFGRVMTEKGFTSRNEPYLFRATEDVTLSEVVELLNFMDIGVTKNTYDSPMFPAALKKHFKQD
jgi:hypothetical protein